MVTAVPLDRVTGSLQGFNCRLKLGLLHEQVVGIERRDDEDADARSHQRAQAFATGGFDLEDFYPPPGLDAFQVAARDDPVVGKAEGEVRVFVEGCHFAEFRAANSRFRSAVYFHHGFFGAPSMYRTATMNVSSRHGSWRWPVMRHSSSYIA